MDMNKPTPDLLSIDFAALDVLCRVHASLSFTRTAEALGVNQSAVSYTIDKLRRVFADPLFVKQAGRQVPTPRCDAIVARAAALLEDYRALSAPEVFDPSRIAAEVTIACNYYERLLLIPAIARHLLDVAPGLRLTVINASSDGPKRLARDEADLLIGPEMPLESGLHFADLFGEHYTCLCDPAHPAAGTAPPVDRYVALDHILITYDGHWRSRYIQEVEAAGHRLSVAMRVPSPAGIAQLVSGTRLVVTLPARLADSIRGDLAGFACPVPAPFRMGLSWSARTHAAPLYRWLRAELSQVARRAAGRQGRM